MRDWFAPFVVVSVFAVTITTALSLKVRQINRDEQGMIQVIEAQRQVLFRAQNVVILQHNQKVALAHVVRDLEGQVAQQKRVNTALAQHDAEAMARGRQLYNALRDIEIQFELHHKGLHTSEEKH